MRRILSVVLSVCLFAVTQISARAETAAYAEITAIDTKGFPHITALLDVFNANGEFMAGLAPSAITVYEDSESRKVDKLTESAVPAQIVVGINPGPALGVRDTSGVPRFTHIGDTLGTWANAQPGDSKDDLSLVSLSGSLISHAAPKDWLVSLSSFKPDFRTSTPNLQSLNIAFDTVNAPAFEAGMKRAILFITPHMDDANIDNTIAPLIQRAIDTKVRVFVWFVDAENQFNSPSANAFKMLARLGRMTPSLRSLYSRPHRPNGETVSEKMGSAFAGLGLLMEYLAHRIKEEAALGKGILSSISVGFSRAFTAIFDSNLTTIISAVFLFQFGTGPIKGFAVTLVMGLTANIFASSARELDG